MSGPAWPTILKHVRGLVRPLDGRLTDAELLARWLASRDQAAFELLVWRHGPTVSGVCQRLLRRPQDVEDAFQATFLVFLRKAGTIGKGDAVASWLYKVAYRVALQARHRSSREELLDGRDVLIPTPPTADAVAWRDVRPVLDDEVNRLPRRYRTVFVLRCLEGKTSEEAARELGLSVGTVRSRLSRARARLRARLTRRGVTLAAGVLAAGWAGEASAGVSASLVSSAMKAALLGAAEQAAAAGVITAQAAALAKGVLHAMWVTKVRTTAVLFLTVVLLGGGGAFTYRTLAAGPADGPSQVSGAEKSARQGNGNAKNDARDQNLPGGDKAENQRLKAAVDEQAARAQALEVEARRQRDELSKYKADNAALTRRVKELEDELARTRTPAPGATGLPPGGADTKAASDTVPTAKAQDAKDAVEILQAQLQVKKAELQGAMVEKRAADRNVARLNALAKTNVVSQETLEAAQDKLARDDVTVRVKEAELYEYEVRLRQATRRLDALQAATAAQRPAAPPVDKQQLQEVRKDLERLQRKIESLEKAAKPPSPGAPRP